MLKNGPLLSNIQTKKGEGGPLLPSQLKNIVLVKNQLSLITWRLMSFLLSTSLFRVTIFLLMEHNLLIHFLGLKMVTFETIKGCFTFTVLELILHCCHLNERRDQRNTPPSNNNHKKIRKLQKLCPMGSKTRARRVRGERNDPLLASRNTGSELVEYVLWLIVDGASVSGTFK